MQQRREILFIRILELLESYFKVHQMHLVCEINCCAELHVGEDDDFWMKQIFKIHPSS